MSLNPSVPHKPALTTAIRLGLRQLTGGLSGFGIFLACIVLGVAAIAAVGSLARGLVDGLAREGQTILGADISFQRVQKEATAEELAVFQRYGRIAPLATTRAMVRTAAGATTLVELKAVEPDAYPLYGTLQSEPSAPVTQHLRSEAGIPGALVEPALLARLSINLGDTVFLGDKPVRIAGTLRSEPDRLAGGIGFGPRMMVSLAALRDSGVVQPGSLVRWHYQLKLDGDTGERRAATILDAVKAALPNGGFDNRSRANASPQLERQVNRFSQFLTLIGLTALLVGGVGVANAVSAYLDRRRDDIATLKAIGASGGTVVATYLTQIAAFGLLGIAIGLVLGAGLPLALMRLLDGMIPLPVATGIYPGELLLALAYGALVALAFALWPLGRAHDVSVSALFRSTVDDQARQVPRLRYVLLCAGALAALAALSVTVAFNQRLAWTFLVASGGVFIALRLVALGIMALARRLPRPKGMVARLALANLHRPGALTPSVILSLGLGLTLLVIIALLDVSITRQLTTSMPERAPAFFFIDIPSSQTDRFDRFIAEKAANTTLERVPMLRGRILALNGKDADTIEAPDDVRWALTGDRGITYADTLPPGSTLTRGDWWPADYSGPPLVSLDERLARGFGLDIGDRVSVNVLGRTIEARIHNLRRIQWDRMGIGFVLVFSSNTFRGAPHTHLATLTYQTPVTTADEVGLLKAVAAEFPAISTVRVKDALEAANGLARQILTGVRGASLITLIASILVLAGALAASHRARLFDAVLLKTLGATRGLVLRAFALEFLALGLITALFAVLVGTVAAYWIARIIMQMPLVFSLEAVVAVAGIGALLTVAGGLIGTRQALSAKPAAMLREL